MLSRNLRRGISCWGLVAEIYRRAGVEITDPVKEPEKAAGEWVQIPWQDRQPMDVLTMSKGGKTIGGHVALYLGRGFVIHATYDRGTIRERVNADRVLSVHRRRA